MLHNADSGLFTSASLMFDFGQGGLEHFTGAAQLHLLPPGIVDRSIANGAVDEPAQVTGRKFPGRTPLALLLGTGSSLPAWLDAVIAAQFAGEQKIELALDVDGNGSPTLLIAVDGLD